MAFKMIGKGPMMKTLIGKQNNLPEDLKAKIEAAPESPLKNGEVTGTTTEREGDYRKRGGDDASHLRLEVPNQTGKYARGMPSKKVTSLTLGEDDKRLKQ